MVPLLFTACNKDYTPSPEDNLEPVSLRSTFTLSDGWINDFYDYLTDLKDNNLTSVSYGTADIADGIEVLMNIHYSEAYADENTTFYSDTISFNSTQENAYDLFVKANTSLTNAAASNDDVVAFNFESLRENGNIKYFKATTILSGGNYQSGTGFDPCSDYIYGKDASFYFGAGEFLPNEPSTWLDCPGNGFDPCGGVENGVMTTTALTEIEKVLNREMPRDYCYVRRFKYLKTKEIVITPGWHKLISYEDAYCNEENVLPAQGYRSCDCLENTDLKNLTSALRAHIHEKIENFNDWDEPTFLGINLATYIDPAQGSDSTQFKRYNFKSTLVIGRSYCDTVLDLPWTVNPDLFD